uniref:efflux RND transporter periplasmic adaptor subunit n=1 Tax=Legionella waltersii TaxID=66969 RepID=UPI001E4DF75D
MSALRKQFLATNAEVQAASQNLEKAKIELLNLQNQQQNQNGTVLRSEVEGTVIAVNVSAGQIIAANSVLLNFSNGENRQIRLGVENEDITKLKVGAQVIITALDNDTSKHLSTISNITGQIDASTGLIDVIVNVTNAPDLIPGSMVKGEILTKPKTRVISVPRSAVLYQQKKPYLFVIKKGKALLRWVVVGEDNGQMVSVINGLKAGERVVTVGNYELTDGLNVLEQKP